MEIIIASAMFFVAGILLGINVATLLRLSEENKRLSKENNRILEENRLLNCELERSWKA